MEYPPDRSFEGDIDLEAIQKQVGGSHYKDCKMQPIDYINANELQFLEGNVVKYVSRHKDKGGEQDIKKAIHCLELILDRDYNK